MIGRLDQLVLSILLICCLGGCDPEALVKTKVPKPIQEALTLEETAQNREIPLEAAIQIRSPKPNQLIQLGLDVVFSAQVNLPPDSSNKPELAWMLKKDKKAAAVIGKGATVKKKLEQGQYTAELIATQGDKRVSKKVDFKVGLLRPGFVKDRAGKGMEGVTVTLHAGGRHAIVTGSTAQTKKNGSFQIEYPSDSDYRISASKPGYSFSPLSAREKWSTTPISFTGYKGEISNIVLTDKPDSQSSATRICPLQTYFLKLKIDIESKPKQLNVFLVSKDEDYVRETPFAVLTKLDEAPEYDDSGRRIFSVRSPSPAATGHILESYTLLIELLDQENVKFEVKPSGKFTIQTKYCYESQMKEAAAFQAQGAYDEALKRYDSIRELYKKAQDLESRDLIAKTYTNSAIIELTKSLNKRSTKENNGTGADELLKAAIQNLEHAVKINKKDAEAIFLLGAAYQILGAEGDEAKALEYYSKAIDTDTSLYEAYRLRAQLYLNTRTKRNIMKAVDDLTTYLIGKPDDQKVRQMRKEALKLYLGHEQTPEESNPDLSEITKQPPGEMIDFSKFIRK